MQSRDANTKIVSEIMFRLLPMQILLQMVGAVNGIVSSFFATNYIGIGAMSAVGVYAPIAMLIGAISIVFVGGSAILCGKYLGRNEHDKVQNVFSLNMRIVLLLAAGFSVLFLVLGLFDLTGFFTKDPAVRPLFNRYLLGQVIGFAPLMLGNQLSNYLAIERMDRRAITAGVVDILVNIVLNILFLPVLHMGVFGLALASSLGFWVFFAIQAYAFLFGRASLRFGRKIVDPSDSLRMFKVGLPGAASFGYQTIRGIVVNHLMEAFVGSVAISAFAAANNLLSIFWAVPIGMAAVSRLMIGISIGEEDRQTLTDVMRVMFRRYMPLMCAISACLILCAVPFTRLFFRDPAEAVYGMTVWGFRILPLCMPLSLITLHFICYAQASGKTGLVNLLAALDGVVCVAGFSALLIRSMGINGVYSANVLNGIVCLVAVVAYSWRKIKHFPRNMEQLMVIPEDFGAEPDARLDLSVQSMDEVVTVSRQVTEFCRRRGIDERRAFLASLCMEEMAGNIVEHGFTKDQKRHSIDIRVVHKDDSIILRIRDDCVPFDPQERKALTDPDDLMKNVGIRLVYKIATSVEYQNLLGLNVLTMRI